MRAASWLLWGLVTGAAWAQPPQVYALVVGIDEYVRPSIPRLRYAVADAKLFAQALQDVVRVPAANVLLMTSDTVDENRQPRLVNVAYQLGWLKERLRAEDTLIFYFAGHGVTLAGDPYLLTEEADNRSALTLKVSALHGGSLLASLRELQIGNVWVVLDACRNHPRNKADSGTLDAAVSHTFSNVDVGRLQTATMMSCKVGERSWEWDEKRHGCYTWFLVNGLREQAADASGRVTLEGLSKYVRDQVPVVASRFGAVQNPTMFYGGPGVDRWTLGQVARAGASTTSEPRISGYVARLDALQARLDQETALRVAAEQRARLAEGQRRELEQRLALLEQQLAGKPSAPLSEAQPQSLAYAQRGLDDSRSQALQAEVERLRRENEALKLRLTQVESKVAAAGLSAREVKLESAPELKERWLRSTRLELEAQQGLATSRELEQRLRCCLSLRQSLGEQVSILEKLHSSELEQWVARQLASGGATAETLERQLAEARNALHRIQDVNELSRLRLEAAERALLEADRRLHESELREQAYQAQLEGLQVEALRCQERLNGLNQELVKVQGERDQALRRLKQEEVRFEQAFPDDGDPWNVRRAAQRGYFLRLIEVPPEATELPAPK